MFTILTKKIYFVFTISTNYLYSLRLRFHPREVSYVQNLPWLLLRAIEEDEDWEKLEQGQEENHLWESSLSYL